ncbi:MAG: transposase [bacterium]
MKYKVLPSSTNLYFTSSVITGHKCLFVTEALVRIILDSLTWLREQGYWKLHAFCVMPNHLHLVINLLKNKAIEKVLSKFHSYTGHEIRKVLKQNKEVKILELFRNAALEKTSDREYLIWESTLARPIETEEVLKARVEYLHNNPVAKKWRLAETRDAYPFSSACYYDRDIQPIIAIDDVRELF